MSTPTGDRLLDRLGDSLCDATAVTLAGWIARGDLSAREVVAAHLARIEAVNPQYNAIVTLTGEHAMADAAAADERQAHGEPLGPLHGLPIAHKDLVDTAGIRTTYGSPAFRDHVPTTDARLVRMLRAAGAITVGKTNTPEFGAGSNTFNPVFGTTVNPYNVRKTVGGSSGGAAVALTTGMLPIADGSDTGGSLRNPAAFTNIVGMRPSPGRVNDDQGSWSPLSTNGPMARTVADTALLLSAIAGPCDGNPLSLDDDPAIFRAPLERDVRGLRIGWFRDLGGLPFDPEILRVVGAARSVFTELGCEVTEAEPDFVGIDLAFETLRHLWFHANLKPLARRSPELVKETIHWEIAEAERQSSADVARALARQSRFHGQVRGFFSRFDYFVLPVTQVVPFDHTTPYPMENAGQSMGTYIDWMRSCWYVSMMAAPAISVPAGFTSDGLPVGLQIVGRPRGDLSVLQLAHAFETAAPHGLRRPPRPLPAT